MSADFYEMDFNYLKDIISEVQEIENVGFIFYDITTKPPGTIEWEKFAKRRSRLRKYKTTRLFYSKEKSRIFHSKIISLFPSIYLLRCFW